jgi:acetyl-CoA carboxylase biotin carboxyl carrier protein
VASAEWLSQVRRVLAYVQASDATEVEASSSDGFRVRLVRRPGRSAMAVPAESRVTAAGESPVEGTPLVAPLTGVFYRAATPGAPPFSSVGDLVAPGAVVGLIETMKIFNEVLAERGGRIAAILVESGQLVHAGDALMTIEDAAELGGGQAQS